MEIPAEVRKCVAFICYHGPNGVRLAGTGFFVGLPPIDDLGHHFVYLVTAEHVIEGVKEKGVDQKAYVRLNFIDKPAGLVELPIEQWIYHPTDPSVDVAVLLWTPSDAVDYLSIPTSMAITDEAVREQGIGAGSEVFITGLFSSHYGRRNNLPIIRVGNIALMPEEPIETDIGLIDAYLIEARSIGGLSGSPVFVHLPPVRVRGGQIKYLKEGSFFYWLGLIHGHWDFPISDTDLYLDNSVRSEQINMGIAIVVPVSKILEVINQPKEVNKRKKAEE